VESAPQSGIGMAMIPRRHLVAGARKTGVSFSSVAGLGLAAPKTSTAKGQVVVVTSGKGGVGKTTCSASIGYGLAMQGHRTCLIDFDIGLRNLDIHLGCERRVIFDFIHVIDGNCRLSQALIKDKRLDNLSLLAASQTRDKEALTEDAVAKVR
jgi:septum site-determining protein MinD